jgi:hypothetical protein
MYGIRKHVKGGKDISRKARQTRKFRTAKLIQRKERQTRKDWSS